MNSSVNWASSLPPCGDLRRVVNGAAETWVFGFEFLEALELNGCETAKLLSPSVVGSVVGKVVNVAHSDRC